MNFEDDISGLPRQNFGFSYSQDLFAGLQSSQQNSQLHTSFDCFSPLYNSSGTQIDESAYLQQELSHSAIQRDHQKDIGPNFDLYDTPACESIAHQPFRNLACTSNFKMTQALKKGHSLENSFDNGNFNYLPNHSNETAATGFSLYGSNYGDDQNLSNVPILRSSQHLPVSTKSNICKPQWCDSRIAEHYLPNDLTMGQNLIQPSSTVPCNNENITGDKIGQSKTGLLHAVAELRILLKYALVFLFVIG